jgi:2-polyprenyl-3-methyl-5-hydroxy-6-metoxy-1,4-benzoquinol methylase
MIEAYKNNYNQYLKDQMTKFESFEYLLYAPQIKESVKYIFSDFEPGLSVLDFCCGDGTGAAAIKEMGFKVEGFDGNSNKVHLAQRHHEGINFFYLEARDIHEIKEQYDIVYASHCFEHFINPISILLKTRRLLKEGGSIILVLPYPNEECEGHPGSNLLRLNKDLDEIVTNFTKHGFEVHRIEKMNFREPEILITLQ